MAGKTNDTNQKILAMAIQMIQDGGENAISLRRLASTLGVTTGAFYKHYANKEQLFSVVTKEISHKISVRAQEVLTEVNDPKEKLLALADVLLIQFQKQPELMNFMFFNPTAQQSFTKHNADFELFNLTTRLIGEILAESQSSNNPQNLFIQIWSFILGYGILLRNKSVIYDKQLIVGTLNDYLREEKR